MKVELLTIVCPVYNHEDFIRKALDGFLMQITNFNFKILIHDDASTDNTKDIILDYYKKFPQTIIPVLQEVNQHSLGISNASIIYPLVKSKYIALCEGDDYWTDPYKLQKQVDFLEANEDYVASFHEIQILEQDGSLVKDYITQVPINYETIEDLARDGNYIHTPSVLFRNVIKSFPEEMQHSPIGDFFLYMLLAEHGKFKHLNDTMAVYRNGVGVFSGETQEKKGVITAITLYLLSDYFNKKADKKIEKIFFERFWLLMNQEGIMNGTINKLVSSKILNLEKIPVLIRSINFYFETKIEESEASALERYKKSVSAEYLLRWLIYKGKKKLGFVK